MSAVGAQEPGALTADGGFEELGAVEGAEQRLGDEAHQQHAALGAHLSQAGAVGGDDGVLHVQLQEVGHVLREGQGGGEERNGARQQGLVQPAPALQPEGDGGGVQGA